MLQLNYKTVVLVAAGCAAALVGIYALFQPGMAGRLEACGYEFERGQKQYAVYSLLGLEEVVVETTKPQPQIRSETRLDIITRQDGTTYLLPSGRGKFTAKQLLEDCELIGEIRKQLRQG